MAGEQLSEEALDLEFTYEDHILRTGEETVQRLPSEKEMCVATTTQNVKVVLYDWCARNWGLEAADWDNAKYLRHPFPLPIISEELMSQLRREH